MPGYLRSMIFGSPAAPESSDEEDETAAPTTQQETFSESVKSPTTTVPQEEEEQEEEETNDEDVQVETQMMEEDSAKADDDSPMFEADTTAATGEESPTTLPQANEEEEEESDAEDAPQTQMEPQGSPVVQTTTQATGDTPQLPATQHDSPHEAATMDTSKTVHFPPMPPRTGLRKDNFQRYRSLSKVFTSLPDKLPDVNTMMMDMLEYTCQITLMETQLDKLKALQTRLERLLPHTVPFIGSGRLNSRLQLVALALDLAHSRDWDTADWQNAILQFKYVKSRMLLPTANDPPPSGSTNVQHRRNTTELSHHPSMTNEYKNTMNQLKFQLTLVKFRENLAGAGNTIRKVESAIDEYRRSLQLIYGSPVPDHLEAFVKADVYSPKRNRNISNAERLSYHCRELHDPNVAHSILLRWAEVILDPPALIQIGYGGVTGVCLPHHNDNDDDDVSSIGETVEPLDETRKTHLSAEDQDAVEQLARVSRRSAEPNEDTPVEASTEDTRKQAPKETNDPPRTTGQQKRHAERCISVWSNSSSSSEDEDSTGERTGRSQSKNLTRLYQSLVKKRRIESYDSSKENADPETGPASPSRRAEPSTDPPDLGDDTREHIGTQANESRADLFEDNSDDETTNPKHAAKPKASPVLESSDDEASKPTTASTPQRAPNAQRNAYTDKNSSDDEEAPFGRQAASAPGRTNAAARLTFQSPAATAPVHRSLMADSPVTSPSRLPRRRRGRSFFTSEEDDAIMEGVEQYGTKWSTIQRHDPRLKNRSQTDIRCRYRNMMKHG